MKYKVTNARLISTYNTRLCICLQVARLVVLNLLEVRGYLSLSLSPIYNKAVLRYACSQVIEATTKCPQASPLPIHPSLPFPNGRIFRLVECHVSHNIMKHLVSKSIAFEGAEYISAALLHVILCIQILFKEEFRLVNLITCKSSIEILKKLVILVVWLNNEPIEWQV